MIRLLVGLGNPGEKYQYTRHNAGFCLLDQIAARYSAHFQLDKKHQALVAKCQIAGQDCFLLKPQTYMNHSGQSVASFAHYYKIPVEAILVAHDELDFPVAKLRLKQGGGHGGHNGLKSIMQMLSSQEFYRLRIGIDHPGQGYDVVAYVLAVMPASERQQLEDNFKQVVKLMPTLVQGDIQACMRLLHQ